MIDAQSEDEAQQEILNHEGGSLLNGAPGLQQQYVNDRMKQYRTEAAARDPGRSNFQYGGYEGGAAEAASRYRQNAEGAQSRQGAQANYDMANQDRAASDQAAGMMLARARGQVPSIAQMQADRQMRQAAAAQASAAASARGPAALALAQQNAAGNTANVQGDISGQAQINAANERMQAEQAAFGAYNARASQAAQMSQYNAALQQQQHGLNDQYSLGMTQAEMNVNNTQLGASENYAAAKSGNYLAMRNLEAQDRALRQQQSQSSTNQMLGAAEGAAEIGVMASDERVKQDVVPVSAIDQAGMAVGGQGADYGRFNFTPVAGDAGGTGAGISKAKKPLVSDDARKGIGSVLGNMSKNSFAAASAPAPAVPQMNYQQPVMMQPQLQPITSDERAKAPDVVPILGAPRALQETPEGHAFIAAPPQEQRPSRVQPAMLAASQPQYMMSQSPSDFVVSRMGAKAKERTMTPEELAQWADTEKARTQAATAAIERTQKSDKRSEALKAQADAMMAGDRAALARGSSVRPDYDPMAAANRAQAGYSYVYRPEHTPVDQRPGERNVGPIAQNLAANPIARTAVKQTPQGVMVLDPNKMIRLHGAGLASAQNQIDDHDERLARLEGRR